MNIRDTILTIVSVVIIFLVIGFIIYWVVPERRRAEKACGPEIFEAAIVVEDHKVICRFENDKVEIRKY